MIFLGITLLMIILGTVFRNETVAAIGIIVSLFLIITLFGLRKDDASKIESILELQQSVAFLRAHGIDYTILPHINQQIIEANTWISGRQELNRSIFLDDFIPDLVDSLALIE